MFEAHLLQSALNTILVFIVVTTFLIQPVDLDPNPNTLYLYRLSNMEASFLTKNNAPTVRIVLPIDGTKVKWGSSLRYSIVISDKEDGLSKYGEIPANEVLMEATYWPTAGEADNYLENLQKFNRDPAGLDLIKKAGCFNCHRDKTRLVGPSWKEMSQRYTFNKATLEKLSRQVVSGSIGNWGDTQMPSNPDLKPEEVLLALEYILKQGSNGTSQIYPGFEGAIRLLEKPTDNSRGVFLLTASYTDSGIDGNPDSRERGQHSIILKPVP